MRKILLAITFTIALIFFFVNIGAFFKMLGVIFSILMPFFVGFLIAYILNFPYKFLYNKALGKMGKKHKALKKLRMPLALVITYVVTFAIFGALIMVLIPQIINNLSALLKDFPSYYDSIQKAVKEFTTNLANMDLPFASSISVDEIVKGISNFFTGSQDITKGVLNWLQSFLSNAALILYNFLMGVVISIYFLIYKESLCKQVKRLAVAFIPIKYLPKIYEIVDITDTKCGRFLVGDILDAAVLGVIFFVVLSIFNFPYASLIAVLCGVSNIIPFFGPFIGATPSAFILFLIDPWLAPWFIVIAFVIQQIDGNILKPKIIGNQVGLSSFWVLFSVIVGGALFGVPGFILGTPIYAVIYSLIAKKARNKIEDKGKIAQEALDFRVLNYTEIAEEQRKLRAEREQEQKRKLQKLLHFDFDDEDDEENEENEENREAQQTKQTERVEDEEKFTDRIGKNRK